MVYDLLGREVVVLANGADRAGAHEAMLSRRGLAAGTVTAGTYVWQLEALGTVQTGDTALVC